MASHTYSPEAHSRAVTKFVKTHLDRIEMRCTKDSGLKNEIVEHTQKNRRKRKRLYDKGGQGNYGEG